MTLVIKEIIRSLRENWEEWAYSTGENSEYRLIHVLTHNESKIRGGILTSPKYHTCNSYRVEFFDDSSFKLVLGFWAKRKLGKAMEFCISKIIASKLGFQKSTPVEKAIRKIDLEE